jgi:hypothetical protein
MAVKPARNLQALIKQDVLNDYTGESPVKTGMERDLSFPEFFKSAPQKVGGDRNLAGRDHLQQTVLVAGVDVTGSMMIRFEPSPVGPVVGSSRSTIGDVSGEEPAAVGSPGATDDGAMRADMNSTEGMKRRDLRMRNLLVFWDEGIK